MSIAPTCHAEVIEGTPRYRGDVGTKAFRVDKGPYNNLNLIELRRYVTKPGKRDMLIELFERVFIESQEACGMVPAGQYRNLDDPDTFVWLRAFADMETRRDALEAFYINSQAWRDHRDDANATMIDSDNVLLLRNARPLSGLDLCGLTRSGLSEQPNERSFVAASICMLDGPADSAYMAAFENNVLPRLQAHAQRIAYFVTEERPNDFPRLPVREGEWAFVATGICPNAEALEAWVRVFDGRSTETLRLKPATRSLYG